MHTPLEANISNLRNSRKGKTEIINEVQIKYICGLCSVINGRLHSPNLHWSIN